MVRTSVFGCRTFPNLHLIYGSCYHSVGKVSTIGQPTRLFQPSIHLGLLIVNGRPGLHMAVFVIGQVCGRRLCVQPIGYLPALSVSYSATAAAAADCGAIYLYLFLHFSSWWHGSVVWTSIFGWLTFSAMCQIFEFLWPSIIRLLIWLMSTAGDAWVGRGVVSEAVNERSRWRHRQWRRPKRYIFFCRCLNYCQCICNVGLDLNSVKVLYYACVNSSLVAPLSQILRSVSVVAQWLGRRFGHQTFPDLRPIYG